MSDPLAGFPVTPPPLPRPVLFDQTWVDLTFIHWAVRPEDVAHLYPAGSRPSLLGSAWEPGTIQFRFSPFSFLRARQRAMPGRGR